MKANHVIKTFVTKDQHEKIKQMAHDNGKTLSSFVKELVFAQNFPLEKMVRDIHRKIMEE